MCPQLAMTKELDARHSMHKPIVIGENVSKDKAQSKAETNILNGSVAGSKQDPLVQLRTTSNPPLSYSDSLSLPLFSASVLLNLSLSLVCVCVIVWL